MAVARRRLSIGLVRTGSRLGQLASLDVPVFDLAYDRQRDQLDSLSGATRFFDVDIRDGSLRNITNGGEIGDQTHRTYGMALDADGLPVMHNLAGSYGGTYPAIVSFERSLVPAYRLVNNPG